MFALLFLVAALEALPEHLRPDPFGSVLRADRTAAPVAFLRAVDLEGARGDYVSCHLVVKLPEGGEYTLRIDNPSGVFQAELYREWFHVLPGGGAGPSHLGAIVRDSIFRRLVLAIREETSDFGRRRSSSATLG